MRATVFLGGGRITSALVAGLRLASYKGEIVVHDRNSEKLRQLKRDYRVAVEPDLHRAVEMAGTLVIAVRPASVRELLKQVGKLERRVLAISLAAGIPLIRLRAALGPPALWVRAMPSPVCRAGIGLTAVAHSKAIHPSELAHVRKLFAAVGTVLEIPEENFDAFTVSFSPSHGYHALAKLADAAEKVGLDRDSALTAAAHALADAIESWRKGSVSLRELLHEAATPGGTAAATIAQMDKDGYGRILERALRAGIAQARANAKK
jgi:pyrroline-5-carboxylate reductase